MVLRESQVEVVARRSQSRSSGGRTDGTEGLLGRVEVAQAGLGKASPRKGSMRSSADKSERSRRRANTSADAGQFTCSA